MAMVFQRLSSDYKEHHTGCTRALLCLFDFRNGRSTRTLLVEAAGARDSNMITIPEPHLAEVCESVVDAEENNMLNDHVLRNLADCSEVDPEKINPEYQNNQLLFKFLQDRSSLLVKDITNSENEHDLCPAFDLSEEKPKELQSYKLSRRRHLNFFHLMSNAPNKDCLSSNNSEVENERNEWQFSFNNIKKKLRRGIFPSRSHFYSAKPSLSIDKGKEEDSGPPMVTETCQCAKFEGCNIYSEAKRHLSEMLKSGESKDRQTSVKLGTILSFPEYSVCPCFSPGKHSDGFLTKNENFRDDHDHLIQTMEFPPEIQPYSESHKAPEDLDSSLEAANIQENTETMPEGDEKATNSCSGSFRHSINGDGNEETASQCLDDSSSLLSKSDSFKVTQILPSPPVSPTFSPTSRKLKDSEYTIDQMDRSSPVSVLQPLFIDNNVDIGPSSPISQTVDKEFQRIQSVSESESESESESSYEYIEAVLLASGIDWDDILLRWISLHDILDPTLFNEVEMLSSEPHDQKLLFDCANEALEDICDGYFRSLAGLSHGKMFRDPFNGRDLIDEIWERVSASMSQKLEFCSWDYLADRDNVGGKWMNVELELELVCSEIEEAIFDDTVEDALVGYLEGAML